jgi:iron(III) transport system ATP-binding protein
MSLILKNILKEFQTADRKTMRAVDHISLELEDGKFHTLLGPSGCGKTTLLRMIAGFEHPTGGDILFEGKRLNDIPAQGRGFSMVFQSYALFPHMSVAENIAYGLKLKKLSKAIITQKVDAALTMLDLHGQENKKPTQMSGGQQQRVALARAMVMEPKVILFDEPLSNLDAKLRLHMRSEIRALQKRLGITAIYVTHDQEEAMAISDQIVVLNKGRIEQVGAPIDVYRKPNTEFVANFLGGANVLPVASLPGDIKFQLMGRDYDFIEEKPTAPVSKAILRPEAIHLSRLGGHHQAKVIESVFLGSRVNYTLRVGETKLSADLAWTGTEEIFGAGENVTFSIEDSTLHFI